MDNGLVEQSPARDFEESSAQSVLCPLKEGTPVMFRVRDTKMTKKRRVEEPIILITPSSVYHAGDGALVVSVPGYGCEIIPIDDIKPMYLYRAGLSMRASKILSLELKKLFKG
jgi:hypothetical protein